jgi:hypothetical protein
MTKEPSQIGPDFRRLLETNPLISQAYRHCLEAQLTETQALQFCLIALSELYDLQQEALVAAAMAAPSIPVWCPPDSRRPES